MITYKINELDVHVYADFVDDETDWRIEYLDADGLLNRYKIKGYPIPFNKKIKVSYSYALTRPSNGEVLKSYADAYDEPNVATFYHTFLPSTVSYGYFAAFQSLNGLCARLPELAGNKADPHQGYRPFNRVGEFVQPVQFSTEITDETQTTQEVEGQQQLIANRDGTITVTVINGVGPYEYKLDNNSYQQNNVFENLSARDYTIYVRDSAGTERFAQVSVRLQDLESEAIQL
ncbi:SprB repeat-containing protein [Porifericola rhodea]|uniref:SprB repeat-containing protein n=1 Tax=Porifericola rhodea TaxID=930972 RepID=UPI0026658491|nr:SprB repeat-containing protein [Porifericola rhodea]WKN31353.1 SprB repeat-containing protein [Porifericola rhodea]